MAKTKPPKISQYDIEATKKLKPILIKTDPKMNSIQPLTFPRFAFLIASCKSADFACLTMALYSKLARYIGSQHFFQFFKIIYKKSQKGQLRIFSQLVSLQVVFFSGGILLQGK
jgi:hypothetical protein